MSRYDYPANRGELDGRDVVRRRPDPFSVVAGCIGCLISAVAVVGAIILVARWIAG